MPEVAVPKQKEDPYAPTELKIRDKHGALIKIVPNRAQEEYNRCAGQRNIVLKARQLGITTHVAAKFFLETINNHGTLTVQVAHDQRAAEAIFRIVHRFLENLPDDARRERLKTSRSNVRQIVFKELDSEYRVETAADSNAGRGSTIHNLHCSEVAMWPGDPAATLAGLRAAVPPHGTVVLESTPRGAAGCFYEEWRRAPETGYVKHFLPWWWDESYRRDNVDVGKLSEEELELRRLYQLDDAQIAFRREVKANFGQRAREEYAEDSETCFRMSGDCVFEIETIEDRLRLLADPSERHNNGELEIYFPPVAGKKYVIGVDPAGGTEDGDYSCAEVLDKESGQQCAELLARLRPQDFASRVADLAVQYGNCTVVVERNNHGHAVLAALNSIAERKSVPNGCSRDMPAGKFRNETIWLDSSDEQGWLTTVANRPPMLELFGTMLRTRPVLLNSRRLLEQCRTFVRGRDGRPEAAPGSHDDAVLAIAIAYAVRERN